VHATLDDVVKLLFLPADGKAARASDGVVLRVPVELLVRESCGRI